MTTPTSLYSTTSIRSLHDRTEYEAWLLEAVYKISDLSLEISDADELIYPSNGGAPTQTIFARAVINIGDWRPGFLEAGAPLVFVTAFKLLDMLLEWVLIENGKTSTFRFAQKIAWLKGPVVFPLIIESRPWLKERLIALYERLEPLRGTIIHDRHFTSIGGALEVSSSKGGVIGPPVKLNSTDLRNFALLLVSLLRFLDGAWKFDSFQEKRLRRTLDEIDFLHGMPSLGQLPPALLNVRIYVIDESPIVCDLSRIRADLLTKRAGQDALFNLRFIAISRDGTRATAYLVPWEQVKDIDHEFNATINELAPYLAQLPNDLNLDAIARDLCSSTR